MMCYIFFVFIILNIFCDINYFLRTFFAFLVGRLYRRKYSLEEFSTIYGMCTFRDCDIHFRYIRDARLLRELDFARSHFYERTGMYQRAREHGVYSLQGCTLTLCQEPIPLFSIYRINTKLVYWDDRSVFLEHQVITLGDGKIKYYLISRQHAVSDSGHSTSAILEGLPGAENKIKCPENIEKWLLSMQVASEKRKDLR